MRASGPTDTGHRRAPSERHVPRCRGLGDARRYVDAWAFDDVFQPALRPLRLGAGVFVVFAVLAVVSAAAGLAAATAQSVTRRTRELGTRLALGAQPGDLVRMLLGRSLLAVGAGAVLAYGVERSLRVFREVTSTPHAPYARNTRLGWQIRGVARDPRTRLKPGCLWLMTTLRSRPGATREGTISTSDRWSSYH